MKKGVKYFIYSLIPTILLLGLAEGIARIFDLARPQFVTAPLPGEFRGMIQPHEELFWALKPNTVAKEAKHATVNINAQGFRGKNLQAKKENEYRIISLGESTTFGAGVEDYETYSYLLGERLNSALSNDIYVNVMNCGFSAYSSFQGLKYLELYGLSYQPDMVLVYFEFNDYLPSTLRSYGFDETKAYLTDKQLYESKFNSWTNKIIASSKFLTFLHYRYAAYRLKGLDKKDISNPFDKVGIEGENPVGGRLAIEQDGQLEGAGFQESNFGQRVSEEERVEIFRTFKDVCEKNNIELVVIHPAYAISNPHQCVLTRFCSEESVKIFEAFPSLHPDINAPHQLYNDDVHPNTMGHQILAKDLAEFIEPYIGLESSN